MLKSSSFSSTYTNKNKFYISSIYTDILLNMIEKKKVGKLNIIIYNTNIVNDDISKLNKLIYKKVCYSILFINIFFLSISNFLFSFHFLSLYLSFTFSNYLPTFNSHFFLTLIYIYFLLRLILHLILIIKNILIIIIHILMIMMIMIMIMIMIIITIIMIMILIVNITV